MQDQPVRLRERTVIPDFGASRNLDRLARITLFSAAVTEPQRERDNLAALEFR
jgi:hypothetical protein